jgi:stress-induced morphogen
MCYLFMPIKNKTSTIFVNENFSFSFIISILAGCGASYEIVVVTDEFSNMRTVNQHRLVSDALSKQLPNIHAIRIFTGTDEKQFLD